ncbi:MAG: TetR family transcriptional regulator [Hyphomicrobiales bacterium]|nr:TetR/AcrR family transcriptional regulator [Hyphomicrobiales bacterium]MDE2017179.1 TetR family transcriptional regulator [Hyphomicrobiales bacterium]
MSVGDAPETGPRARILAAAAAEIASRGGAGARVTAIARAAGMSHANVYRFFPTRAALFDEIARDWLSPIEAAGRAIAEGPDPAADKLERTLIEAHRAYVAKRDDAPETFRLFAEAVESPGSAARRHRGRMGALVQRILDDGAASGAFAPFEPARAANLVADATHRFTHPSALWLDRDMPANQSLSRLRRTLDLLVRGLRSGGL